MGCQGGPGCRVWERPGWAWDCSLSAVNGLPVTKKQTAGGKARVLRIANAALKGRSSTVMHTLSREPSLSISTKLLGTAAVTADT